MSISVGVEIGGTKLQVGAGRKGTDIIGLARTDTDPAQGGEGIRQILPELIEQALHKGGFSRSDIASIGVGFGGPVNSTTGTTILSHQVPGWDDFPLAGFLRDEFSVPVAIENDASIAGWAEAQLGAGVGYPRIFYMTIGSGIGGGLITNGILDCGQGLGAAEIGHTWIPCPETGEPEKLEQVCSGWSIASRAIDAIQCGEKSILTSMCDNVEWITAKTVYAAAEKEDLLACTLLDETCHSLALGICNVIALLHPNRVIIGGGVSLMGDLFWEGLRGHVRDYVFEPFQQSYDIVPAALGEEVVVIGALLLGESIQA
jgi:glucokinase